MALVETLARWRPGSADNAPLLGPSRLPGLVLATGHFRNGVLLAPATGDALAELLSTGTVPALAAPFEDEILAYLEAHPEGVRLSELQAYFGADRAKLESLLTKLVQEGAAHLDPDRKLYRPGLVSEPNGR